MKKTAFIVCLLVLVLAFSISAFADESTNELYTYNKDDMKYTVDFSGSTFSDDEKDAIAQRLLGLTSDEVQTYGIMCSLFGHKYEESTVGVITHKVRTYAPRCLDETYDVKVCSRCDHQEQTIIASTYIICCPED